MLVKNYQNSITYSFMVGILNVKYAMFSMFCIILYTIRVSKLYIY